MNVIHDAGMRTAWSDKHAVYESFNGPSGNGMDDFFAPEVDSNALHHDGTPVSDPRHPDVWGVVQVGVVYTGGHGKIAEHGGANASLHEAKPASFPAPPTPSPPLARGRRS
jgi:hypothetical protein